jgi:hypothetical protein
MTKNELDAVSEKIIGAAYKVSNTFRCWIFREGI